MRHVLQVFFRKDFVPSCPELHGKSEFLGLPLWQHDNHSVYRWAIDWCVAGEERWIVFGPFETWIDSLAAWEGMPVEETDGYRIFKEHAFQYTPGCQRNAYRPDACKKIELPYDMWTDG